MNKQKRIARSGKHPKITYFYRFKDANGKTYVGLALYPLKRPLDHLKDAMKGDKNAFNKILYSKNKTFTFGIYPYKVSDNRKQHGQKQKLERKS